MAAAPEALPATATPTVKLRPPRVRHSELWRQSILNREVVQRAEILAVAAPTGFGKSTLVAQWAARSQRPLVWLTCDQTDSDPLVLIGNLQAALGHALPEYVPPTGPFTADEPAYSSQVLPGFLGSLEPLGPLTAVIENAHFACGESTGRVLAAYIDALPEGSQVALVGRSLPALPLALWRGQGRVADLGAEDLAFSPEETRAALVQFTDRQVSDHDVLQVQAATDGWPVAVYLHSQADAPGREVSNIEELVETEVLAPMRPGSRTFVVQTAVLGTVNPELAAAATGEAQAGRFLAEASGTLLVRTTADHWYRYHPVLQEYVTKLLSRDDPALLHRVLGKAALWHLGQGHIEQAVQLALAAEAPQVLGEVLWPASRISLLQGRTTAVQDWLTVAGEQAILQEPLLGMAAAWGNLTIGDFGGVLRCTRATLRHMPDGWREDLGSHPIGPHLAMLLAVTGQAVSDPTEGATLALAAVDCVLDDDPTLALANLIAGLNLALIGDPTARPVVERAAAIAGSAAIPVTEVESLALLGLLRMVEGEDTAGCDIIEAAQSVYARHDLGRMATTTGVLALAKVTRCAVRGTEGETRTATVELNRITALLDPVFPWYRPLAGAVLAFADVRLGDLEAFQRHSSWIERSQEASPGLCDGWLARARREYQARSPLRDLSPAELRVWEMLKGRMTLSEIATALFLSRETVKTHTAAIYRKLGVSSRRQAQEISDSWS